MTKPTQPSTNLRDMVTMPRASTLFSDTGPTPHSVPASHMRKRGLRTGTVTHVQSVEWSDPHLSTRERQQVLQERLQ